jgi:hypothetical protein
MGHILRAPKRLVNLRQEETHIAATCMIQISICRGRALTRERAGSSCCDVASANTMQHHGTSMISLPPPHQERCSGLDCIWRAAVLNMGTSCQLIEAPTSTLTLLMSSRSTSCKDRRRIKDLHMYPQYHQGLTC